MTRTGGQLLVEGLKRWGVDVIFGIPGVQLDWFFDAVAEDGSIEVVHTRHEQAAAYMADGYARSTGRVGVCAVVPGPGVLNALAALCTAYATNSPVLCLTGHVFGGDAVNGMGALHELPDQTAAINAVIRRSARARRPDEVPGIVDDAFVALTAPGRRRPYALEVGPDVLGATIDDTTPVVPNITRPWELASKQPVYRADLDGAGHLHFANACAIGQALLDFGVPLRQTENLVPGYSDTCGPDDFSIDEAARIQSFYVTAFFKRHLLHDDRYDPFLTESWAADNEPLVLYQRKDPTP